ALARARGASVSSRCSVLSPRVRRLLTGNGACSRRTRPGPGKRRGPKNGRWSRMAPVLLSPELKEYVVKTYTEFATADPLSTRGVIRAGTRPAENCRPEAELEGHPVVC